MRRVLFRPQAARDLQRLEDRDRDQVEDAIERFAQTGSGDVKRLVNEGRQLRLRAGAWRIRFIYEKPDYHQYSSHSAPPRSVPELTLHRFGPERARL